MTANDDAPVWVFRNEAYQRFMDRIAEIVRAECPDSSIQVTTNRRYMRITKALPEGERAVAHGFLTWTEDFSEYFLIELDDKDNPIAVGHELMSPRAIANRILEILSQLNVTP